MYSHEMIRQFMEEGIAFNEFLGMIIESLGHGTALMRIPMRREFMGDPYRPAVHGGVISSLADTVGGLAVFTCLDVGRVASTVDLRVDYLRPGRIDQDLWGCAEVLRVGNRVGVTRSVVYQDDESSPVATAAAVYNVVQMKQLVVPADGGEPDVE